MLNAGGVAIVALLTEDAAVAELARREVRVSAIDAEDRLVRWLNEVLYWACVEGFLIARAELEVDEEGLRGRVWGESNAGAKLRTEIKAATYHDLTVGFEPGRVWARVVLDV